MTFGAFCVEKKLLHDLSNFNVWLRNIYSNNDLLYGTKALQLNVERLLRQS